MIVGILLAAGASRRFGAPKLLHRLSDGTPIGLRSALNLAAAVDRAVAVLAPEHRELEGALREAGVETYACAASRDGMGASLACGVHASADAQGWIIALADMPFVQSDTIRAVAEALRKGARIVAPVDAGVRGHPVGFHRVYGAELSALTGDAGARHIVARDQSSVVLLPVDDPGIHRDIDMPSDLPH